MLRVSGRAQQPVDETLVRFRIVISCEVLDLFEAGRQSRQIQRYAIDQRRPVGFRARREALLLETSEDEAIDIVDNPAVSLAGWWLDLFRRYVGPVRLILRTVFDPPSNSLRLLDGQGFADRRRRHHDIWISRTDPSYQLAAVGISRDDGELAFQLGKFAGGRLN